MRFDFPFVTHHSMQAARSLSGRFSQIWVRPKEIIQVATSNYQQASFHEDYDPKFEERSFKLDNGRTIGFAEYGSRSKSSVAAIFCHGAPGSRYDGIAYHDSGKKLDVRVICPDRPGHGFSTHVPDRKLIDYPSEISQLAQHLGIEKYHVFGQSGGGPYAVACAHGLPNDELISTTVVAGMGPPQSVNFAEAGYYTTIALWFHVHTPGLLQRCFNWWYTPEYLRDDEAMQKDLNRMYKLLPEKDRKELENAKEGQALIRAVVRTAFSQGGTGTIRDGQIYALQDLWGFNLEDVEREVKLIYADEDNRTPIAFAKRYQAGLKHSDLWVMKGASHFRMDDYLDEILARTTGKKLPEAAGESSTK